MDEKIYQIAEQIVQLDQKAYEIYLPLVEDVCSRGVSEAELSHLLDYLLDFACDEKILVLYQKQDVIAEHMLIAILPCHLQLGFLQNFSYTL